MKIYRVHELPYGANNRTIGVCDSDGVIHIKKGLPLPIEIVTLIHEVGHHIDWKITSFFYKFLNDYRLAFRFSKIWDPFFTITTLVCRKWLPRVEV